MNDQTESMHCFRAIFFAAFILGSIANGQIFRLDQSNFPTVTVWHLPQDDMQLAPPLRIRDNNIPVTLNGYTCHSLTPNQPIELVLCVDISSSHLAWADSRAILDTIAATISSTFAGIDCRIHVVAFNTSAITQRDRTAADLLKAFATLTWSGGTRYAAALEEAAALLSSPSNRSRWIVIITDGLDTLDTGSALATLGAEPPHVVAVMLRNEAPESLRELARRTNGGWIELISDPGAAAQCMKQLAGYITGRKKLCQLQYTTTATCSANHDVQLEYPLTTYGMRYRAARTGALEVSTSHVYFGVPLTGTIRDASITLTARQMPVRLDSVWIVGSPQFSIVSPAMQRLRAEQSTTITVRYNARDTNAAWGELHIRTSCGEQIITFSVGRRFARVVPSPFRVVSPSGGNRFFSGSDIVVQWEGIPPDDSCLVRVSTDGGSSWQLLASDASSGRFRWKVPFLDRALEARFQIERSSNQPIEVAISEPVIMEPTTGIIEPTDLGQATIGIRKDTLLRALIHNRSAQKPLIIERIEFQGEHAADFGVASGVFPMVIPPSSSLDLELFFTPSAAGRRSAELLLVTPGGYVRQLVWGHGVGVPPRSVIVDFGVVPVGSIRSEQLYVGESAAPTVLWNGDSTAFAIEASTRSAERIIRFTPDSTRLYQATARVRVNQQIISLHLRGRGIQPARMAISDPTRFRTLIQPTAEQLPAGTAGIGSYNGIGLLGIYAPTRSVAVFGGGMIPITINRTRSAAYGLGIRAAFQLDSLWSIGLGGALGQSISNSAGTETTITLAAPFANATLSLGKARLNASIGYVFKEHRSPNDRFRADVPIVAFGGDVLIAPQWKLAADIIGIGTVDHVPVVITARYFGQTFSLDGGVVVAVPNTAGASLVAFPVVSAFWMFR